MNLTFDEQSHRYTIDGFPVPSVTQLIQSVMKRDWTGAEFARDRGTAVHLATSMSDAGTLDETSLDERIIPYVQAWRRFREESKASVILNESVIGSARYRYCGTLDRVMEIGNARVLVDIKTGSVMPEVQVQLALYDLACIETHGIKVYRRLAIHLDESGSYKCHWFDDKRDKQLALSFLAVAQWLKSSGEAK